MSELHPALVELNGLSKKETKSTHTGLSLTPEQFKSQSPALKSLIAAIEQPVYDKSGPRWVATADVQTGKAGFEATAAESKDGGSRTVYLNNAKATGILNAQPSKADDFAALFADSAAQIKERQTASVGRLNEARAVKAANAPAKAEKSDTKNKNLKGVFINRAKAKANGKTPAAKETFTAPIVGGFAAELQSATPSNMKSKEGLVRIMVIASDFKAGSPFKEALEVLTPAAKTPEYEKDQATRTGNYLMGQAAIDNFQVLSQEIKENAKRSIYFDAKGAEAIFDANPKMTDQFTALVAEAKARDAGAQRFSANRTKTTDKGVER